jgi:hypothetical protein
MIAPIVVAACGGGGPATSQCPNAVPAAQSIERIDEIPDYTQTDPAYGGFQPDGNNFCGPASVSNSLMWATTVSAPRVRAARPPRGP